MFKLFGCLLTLLGILLCITILFFIPGIWCILFGGIFLCIHKYLHSRRNEFTPR
jgi:hypothetical protein